jgi:hypothetical protein
MACESEGMPVSSCWQEMSVGNQLTPPVNCQALPEDLANTLLEKLIEKRQIAPPDLELFGHRVTVLCLDGRNLQGQHVLWLRNACKFG